MRRAAAILVVAGLLAGVPAAGALAAPRASGDGTLALVHVSGSFTIAGRGSLIGRIDKGRVTILDRGLGEGDGPIVTGWERARDLASGKSLYAGSDVNFRLLGGSFKIAVQGQGIDLSFVGRGTITLGPAGGSGGTLSLDGGDTYRPLPGGTTTFSFPPGP